MESTLERIIQIYRDHKDLCKDKSYNIFSVLQIQSKEVLICRMIADLLNPRGQHGSGADYLGLFLNNTLRIHVADADILNRAVITAEYKIDENRRIDIVIEADKLFLPMEVKIYAGDQESQCYDYYYFAKRKDNDAKVYYLTLDGHFPTEYSTTGASGVVPNEDVVCLSFKEDILKWLRDCKTVGNPEMIPILNQFIVSIETVSGYTDERLVNMVSEELIKSEETLRAGIQIADSINVAKAKVLYLLFDEFEKQLKGFAKENNWSRERTVNWYEYRDMADVTFYKEYSTYPGINYVVNDVKMNSGYQLWFRVEVEQNLFAGFCVFDPNGQSPEGQGNQVDTFNDETKEAVSTYLNVLENDQENWWATWWYLPSGEKKATDSVPNFKTMNDAAIALTDGKKREAFVAECMRQIEAAVKKVVKH